MTKFEKSVFTCMLVFVVLYFMFSLIIAPFIGKSQSQYKQIDIIADSSTMKSFLNNYYKIKN